MNRDQRKRKAQKATAHRREQKIRRAKALEESVAAAKKSKKGKAGIKAQMEKRGYLPNGRGGWRTMHHEERERRQPKTPSKHEEST